MISRVNMSFIWLEQEHVIYTGKTTETLSKSFSKQKCDNAKRPSTRELGKHFNEEHNFVKDLEFTIL